MRKNDIQFRGGYACINIKVPWSSLDVSIREARADGAEEIPAGLTEEWIRENVTDEQLEGIFWHVCESEYEYFTDWASEIMPGTKFTVDGRSGGWAVSNHSEDDVEGWDAIALGKWGKIERVARELARGVNAQIIYSIAINEYVPYSEAIYVDAAPVGEAISGCPS